MSRRIVDSALVSTTPLVPVTKVRVLYDDTDKMGIVYHGSYLRFMEHGRVELIRAAGIRYAEMERLGYGLPVTDIGVTYLAPAIYDDLVTLQVGLSKLGWARVCFAYRLVVMPGDRLGPKSESNGEEIEILRAESRHGCVSMENGRPAKMPDEIHERLSQVLNPTPREGND